MSLSRPDPRRFALLTAVVALVSAGLAVPIAAANMSVTGSLSYREKIVLTPKAAPGPPPDATRTS